VPDQPERDQRREERPASGQPYPVNPESVESLSPGLQGEAAPASGPGGQDRAGLAREALRAARADAAARGRRATGPLSGAAAGGRADPAARPRLRREDPEPLNAAISGLIDEQGWRLQAKAGAMFGRWDQIVGPELAAHTRPDGFADGELTITADSTAWATQVRLLAPALVRRLNAELGDGSVTRVKIRGPATQRRPGQWRTRDSRGPRDTYG
jgi:predicted nucleic acid-binding Zn ribbon protein